MKLERISLSRVGREGHVVDFTSGMTVVEAPTGESTTVARTLVGALSTAEDGVHVEWALDEGTDLVAFRPAGAPHRVIDLGSGEDVSGRHTRSGGGVDLLATWRGDGSALERELTTTGAELASPDPTEAWMTQLASIDTDRLLATAEAEVAAEQALRRATAAARAAPEDSGATARLTAARQRRARAARRHQRLRIATFVAAAIVPIATLIGFNAVGTAGGLILLGGTLILAVGCFVAERRQQRTLDAEDAFIRAASSNRGLRQTNANRPPPGPLDPSAPTEGSTPGSTPAAPGANGGGRPEPAAPAVSSTTAAPGADAPSTAAAPGAGAPSTPAGAPSTAEPGRPDGARADEGGRAGGNGAANGRAEGSSVGGMATTAATSAETAGGPVGPAGGPVGPAGGSSGPEAGPDGSSDANTDAGATLAAAAERYKATSASWQRLAGNVPAPWVLDQRDRIRVAAQLRAAAAPPAPARGTGADDPGPADEDRDATRGGTAERTDAPATGSAAAKRGLGAGSNGSPAVKTDGTDADGVGAEGRVRPSTLLISAITSRAAALRARTGGESLPLLLDEPLVDLDWAEKAPVLEFLGRLAPHQQVVVITADGEVLSWARLEAMTGSVGITSGLDLDDGVANANAGEPAERSGRPADPSHQGAGPSGDTA